LTISDAVWQQGRRTSDSTTRHGNAGRPPHVTEVDIEVVIEVVIEVAEERDLNLCFL
jgi:hypothetical protein